jgi:hypothetical protein
MSSSIRDGHREERPAVGARGTWRSWPQRAADGLGDERVCRVALVAAMALYAALALWVTRGTTLFVDEKTLFVQDRGLSLGALLTPLNGHLVLLQRALYATVFKLVGPEFLIPRLVEVAGVVVVVELFFRLARDAVGPALALAPALVLLFLGSAWELNFVVSGIGNVYAVAAGLGALLALPRRTRRADALACALLVVAVESFTAGVAFAAGALILIALAPERRRRLWVALLPLALYVAWLIWVRAVYVPAHGEAQQLKVWNILLIPNFVADEAASLAGALAGLNYDFGTRDLFSAFSTSSAYGPVLAALAVAALALRVRRGPVTPTVWAYLGILLTFWIMLALGVGTGRNPSVVRYVYVGAVVALLAAAEAARGVRVSSTALVVVYAVAAIALAGNLARLRDGAHVFRDFATTLRGQLAALELARDHVDPAFMPATGAARFDVVRAGPYLAAVRRIGSPAYTESELARRPEGTRRDADAVLVAALGLRAAPTAARARTGPCTRAGSAFLVASPDVAVTSDGGGRLSLGRFASEASVPVGELPAGRSVDLAIPRDRSRRPWRALVTGGSGRVLVCRRG